jgi:hypothetical protein
LFIVIIMFRRITRIVEHFNEPVSQGVSSSKAL